MSKPFLKNAWYAAAWSYEVKKELFERTIIGESILFYRGYSLNAGLISVSGVQSGP